VSKLKSIAFAALTVALFAVFAGPAAARDRNHDRIPDRWEKRHHLSTRVDQAGRDQDRDHLRNRAEFLAGDNPRDRDSDDDGVADGDENAGTISSFDAATGRLTIALFGGDEISGLVDEGTRIKCEDEDEHSSGASARASHEEEVGDDRGGKNSGPGDGGEDNSGPGSSSSGPGPGGNDNEAGVGCAAADLTLGAVVEEAELELEDGVATFEEVELAG